MNSEIDNHHNQHIIQKLTLALFIASFVLLVILCMKKLKAINVEPFISDREKEQIAQKIAEKTDSLEKMTYTQFKQVIPEADIVVYNDVKNLGYNPSATDIKKVL